MKAMIDFSTSIFKQTTIPPTTKIIFVSDMFTEDYVGGAELTSQALIETSPFELFKLHSRDVTIQLINQNHDKFWVFGNFTQVDTRLLTLISSELKYSILEYDYKYCVHRSPEKHQSITGFACDCHGQQHGKSIAAFYLAATHLWWMSTAQMVRYHKLFPALIQKQNSVLSSVFSSKTLDLIRKLRLETTERKDWIVLGSNSWIKGADAARQWCTDNQKSYEFIWNVPYEQLLRRLARAEGFVYLPLGGDTCPRMVIEARLLGCSLQLNENVQHATEPWFLDKLDDVEAYLRASSTRFWAGIKQVMKIKYTISGYTTTYNCIKQNYPLEQCIRSMQEFCDEICVVDGGSTDGTMDVLMKLQRENARTKVIKVKQIIRDWSHPRHAVFDGMQKAEARKMCTQEFCWQMDCDEIVHEIDAIKIQTLIGHLSQDANIVALPVIEYWGGQDKVRMDITPWKWRLSRNLPNITHGIPKQLQRHDAQGNIYAAEGTDGCDMIDAKTSETLGHMSFYTQDADRARNAALNGDKQAYTQYQNWFNLIINTLPGVHHYSWYDIERKIRLYRDYWQSHWLSLYDKCIDDTSINNMFFDCPWSEVTDEMITQRAKRLASETGGHVFHTKWTGQSTPSMVCTRSQPKWMITK